MKITLGKVDTDPNKKIVTPDSKLSEQDKPPLMDRIDEKLVTAGSRSLGGSKDNSVRSITVGETAIKRVPPQEATTNEKEVISGGKMALDAILKRKKKTGMDSI